MASSAGNSDAYSGLLAEERAVLTQIGELVDRVAATDLSLVSREDLADIVSDMAAESERLSAMAGRFMAVGEQAACSYTKGERTMIGLVNSKGRLSRLRAASIRRAGRAMYRFPSFHTALMARQITLAHIDLITRWAKKANSTQVRDAEPALAAVAVLTTPEEFEDALRTWVAVAEPDEHLDEFLRAQARRHLILQPDLFSNVHVTGVMDPLLGEQVMNTIFSNADRLREQDESLSILQANHDALVQLVLSPHGKGIRRPHLEVLVPANHLDPGAECGRENTATRSLVVGDRSFSKVYYPRTAGGNLIPPAVIRALAPTSRIRYHRLAPDGSLADDVASGREFSAVQRRMIRLRDTTCRHTGCRRPAPGCEYDHVRSWSAHGPTLIANGQLLCRFHHRWKHRDDPGPNRPRHFADSPLVVPLE